MDALLFWDVWDYISCKLSFHRDYAKGVWGLAGFEEIVLTVSFSNVWNAFEYFLSVFNQGWA